MAFSGS
nr:unnamed protein product [Callosobruchus analis]